MQMTPIVVENRTDIALADGKHSKQIEALRAEVRASLQRKKEQIYAEIRAYPSPIPACDAQYNYLLEQRDLVNHELQQLDTLSDEPMNPLAVLARLKAMVAASTILDKETRRRIVQA